MKEERKQHIVKKYVPACTNCPNLENHIHFDGKIEAIPKTWAG